MLEIKKKEAGFTLVELLVVMAIMAVLIGISVAGLGFAMRRSRNIARSAAMSNLDKALASHYADEQQYPAQGNLDSLVSNALNDYLEGTWDPGAPNSVYCYRTGNTNTIYAVCVSQEDNAADNSFVCLGPGVGKSGWPQKEQGACTNCGNCRKYTGSSWGNATSGDLD